MEGKGILFKKFADIDVFDIELNAKNPDDVIRACEMLEPTFGGINLEDIKAPECFYIEEELKKRLKIPVFHDDQHGTAVISGAAFLNALEVVGKKIEEVRVVFCGGGAAAIACASLYLSLGVRRENMMMADSKGVIYKGRKEGMNPYKERFAVDTKCRTIAEALKGADAFVGVSVKDGITPAMVASMAKDPIIFAMANPDPEVLPEEVLKLRPDAIMATGRSDYPNQVNNVLGFPFIFRGALDTLSTAINEEMKMAAVRALARLAKEEVPESVSRAYGGQSFKFGRDYLIPKPFDRRALLWVSTAVAEAAMKSGVARKQIDLLQYRERLEAGGDMAFRTATAATLRVGLEHPEDPTRVIGIATLKNHQSICGSAGNRRAWATFHHIINPHTLESPRNILAVWALANSTLEADALTSGLFFTTPQILATEFLYEYAIMYANHSVEYSPHFPGEFF
jgi:malate dehydrogenase (oxaloacetate-decarboxylating)(NADP+)